MTARRNPVLRFLASPKLALVLIVFVGTWSLLSTIVPQGPATDPGVVEWAAARGFLASVTGGLGLHEAFTAPLFMAATILLVLSTAVCSWDRTRVAVARSRSLSSAARSTPESLQARGDVTITAAPGTSPADALSRAADALETLGVKAVQRDGVLLAVSRPWSVWGSPVFHWALVLLALAAFAGVLVRSEGTMGIAVGETRADQESAYVSVETGPLHSWNGVRRSIRVDGFEPSMMKDSLDLGAVPTVSVLDENGEVVVSQPVYPNNKLHAGSLSINAPDCGLSLVFQLVAPSGSEVPPVQQLVDFSQESTSGTVPLAPLALSDGSGQVLLRMNAVVPLDRQEDGTFGEWIPEDPRALVWLADGSGAVLYDGPIGLGETKGLAGGGTITLADVGWYSRLSLVDDPTIPFVYAAMIVAMAGLTLSLVSRQQLIAATTVAEGDAVALAVSLRMWRNVPATRDEIVQALTAALAAEEEGTIS